MKNYEVNPITKTYRKMLKILLKFLRTTNYTATTIFAYRWFSQ